MKVKLNNGEIFSICENYDKIKNDKDLKFSAKLIFCIYTNMKKLYEIKKDILLTRNNIILKFGVKQSNGDFSISIENQEKANKELKELSTIEHEIEIIPISINEFNDLNLSLNFIDTINFMININDNNELGLDLE